MLHKHSTWYGKNHVLFVFGNRPIINDRYHRYWKFRYHKILSFIHILISNYWWYWSFMKYEQMIKPFLRKYLLFQKLSFITPLDNAYKFKLYEKYFCTKFIGQAGIILPGTLEVLSNPIFFGFLLTWFLTKYSRESSNKLQINCM